MTGIQWTNRTWNPIRALIWRVERAGDDAVMAVEKEGWHCERVSPGCERCYAEAQNVAQRFGRGTGFRYNRQARDQVDVALDQVTLGQPFGWGKRRQMVFTCSMSDLFGEWVPADYIDAVLDVIERCPQHVFQLLTKRHERMRDHLNERYADRLPPANLWAGVSAENQHWFDERWEALRSTRATLRFVSFEPLLGHIDIDRAIPTEYGVDPAGKVLWDPPPDRGLDWAIVGGESGAGARPCDVEWIRSIVRQCQAASVPVFVKQLGPRAYAGGDAPAAPTAVRREYLPTGGKGILCRYHFRDRKGGDPGEWPEDLRVREWPGVWA